MENQASYLDWVNNEYKLWYMTLQGCLVDKNKIETFRSIPQVNRMVGASSLVGIYPPLVKDLDIPWNEIKRLDLIGSPNELEEINGYSISTITLRYIYYANKVLGNIQELNPIRIVEIGGGYGGFSTMLHALACHRKVRIDEYSIYDLPEVQQFQDYYINNSINKSKLFGVQLLSFLDSSNLDLFPKTYNYCVSFYALGEFDRVTKNNYINKIISHIDDGFILWNPHDYRDYEGEALIIGHHKNSIFNIEFPLTSPYNQEITIKNK